MLMLQREKSLSCDKEDGNRSFEAGHLYQLGSGLLLNNPGKTNT